MQSDMLELSNAKQKQGITLSMTPNSAGILISGSGQNINIEADSDGANLALYGKNDPEHFLVSLGKDGTGMELVDQQGFQTHMGITETEVARTGESLKRSAASLMMLAKDGQVIWSAP
jgi:hypothetical protein